MRERRWSWLRKSDLYTNGEMARKIGVGGILALRGAGDWLAVWEYQERLFVALNIS